ncbi:hypothetical protein [Mycolicibacter arupensis]|nr:hypothetical protein [Mycolicibacter arupensis]MCV7277041.1 hypothetical protein [Mycolicibacter arupensis]
MSDQPDSLAESLINHWQAGYEAATTKPDLEQLGQQFAEFYATNVTH